MSARTEALDAELFRSPGCVACGDTAVVACASCAGTGRRAGGVECPACSAAGRVDCPDCCESAVTQLRRRLLGLGRRLDAATALLDALELGAAQLDEHYSLDQLTAVALKVEASLPQGIRAGMPVRLRLHGRPAMALVLVDDSGGAHAMTGA